MTTPFVLITTHRIKPGRLDELVVATREYNDFVEANEPLVQAHVAYVDEGGDEISLVQVHPDAESADSHLQLRASTSAAASSSPRPWRSPCTATRGRPSAMHSSATPRRAPPSRSSPPGWPAASSGREGARPRRVRHQRRARRQAAGRDPPEADRVVDLRAPDRSPFVAALDGIDVVVNAAGSKTPAWWRPPPTAAPRSSTSPPRRPMWRRSSTARAAGAGGAQRRPGTRADQPAGRRRPPGGTRSAGIDIALVLGAGERHGRRGWRGRSRCWGAGSPIPPQARACATTRGRRFDLPGPGTRRLYRADFSDQHVLTRDLGVAVRSTSASTSAGGGHAGRPDLGPGGSHVPQGYLPATAGWRWPAARTAPRAGPGPPAVACHRRRRRCPAGRRTARRCAPPAQVMDIADVPAGAGIEVAGARVG